MEDTTMATKDVEGGRECDQLEAGQYGPFNPSYNDAETADLILASKDKTLFRVHSVILAIASSVFSQMLGVQRDARESSDTPIELDESSEVIEGLLNVFYPNQLLVPDVYGTPTTASFPILREIAVAADKYDMPSVTRVIRKTLFSSIAQHPPVSLYGLARRLDWTEEAKIASTATLSCSLRDAKIMESLQMMDSTSVVLLYGLHQRRRDAFERALNLPDLLMFLTTSSPPHKGSNVIEYWLAVRANHKCCRWNMLRDRPMPPASPSKSEGGHNPAPGSPGKPPGRTSVLPTRAHLQAWLAFTQRAMAEMDRSLTGDSLRSEVFWAREDFANLWTLTCPNVTCATVLFDKKPLKGALLRDLDACPNSI